MRKATKVLLLVSEILCWVGLGAFLLLGIIYIAMGASVDFLVEYLQSSGDNIAYSEVEQIIAPMLIAIGCIFLVIGLINIATGVLTHKIRKAYLAGGSKADFKGKAIALIVLGALSNDICIVPAIFLLCQKDESYRD